MGRRTRRIRRLLLGDRPRAIFYFVLPTFLAIALDVTLRARSLLVFPLKEWVNYFGSSLASAGFWGGSLWMMSRLLPARTWPARIVLGLYAALFVFPLATFSFGGQLLYFRVFHAYMARDTIRLGIALFHTPGLPLERKALIHAVKFHPWDTTKLLWSWEWHALVVWAIAAILLAPLLQRALRPALEHMLNRLHHEPIIEK